MNINLINFLFGIGTVAIQILIIKLLVVLTIFDKIKNLKLFRHVQKHSMHAALILAVGATLGSLYYSIFLGWLPCDLCWYQRIFMYPQVLIMAIAIWTKDAKGRIYTMWFSAIGAGFALYQTLLQFGVENPVITECSTEMGAVGCSSISILQFGYITFPVMSLSVFIAMFLLAYIYKK